MEVWEAGLTLAFIPVVVFLSWYAEQEKDEREKDVEVKLIGQLSPFHLLLSSMKGILLSLNRDTLTGYFVLVGAAR